MSDLELRPDGSRYDSTSLSRAPRSVHERIVHSAGAPAFDDLVGWEFDGINTRPGVALLGIKKFIKGFYEGPTRTSKRGPEPFIQGYNIQVRGSDVEAPHDPKPSAENPRRADFYRAHLVVPGARHSRYPQAMLLDYSLGGDRFVASSPLRDYLVQVYPDDRDLLLGIAFYDLGFPLYLSCFTLRRRARHDFKG